jgi:transcriptional regulator with XRE-family HTH domain
MIKKKFVNPGAYSIFVNQLQKDGLSQKEVAHIMDIDPPSYLSAIKRGDANPSYSLAERTDVALKTYFHLNEDYKRHLRKIAEVYEPESLVEWLEFHEDLEYFAYELGWSMPLFNKYITEKLRDKTIKFITVADLSWCVDEWEDNHIGDFNPSKKTFYSNLYKRSEDE